MYKLVKRYPATERRSKSAIKRLENMGQIKLLEVKFRSLQLSGVRTYAMLRSSTI